MAKEASKKESKNKSIARGVQLDLEGAIQKLRKNNPLRTVNEWGNEITEFGQKYSYRDRKIYELWKTGMPVLDIASRFFPVRDLYGDESEDAQKYIEKVCAVISKIMLAEGVKVNDQLDEIDREYNDDKDEERKTTEENAMARSGANTRRWGSGEQAINRRKGKARG